MSGRKLPRSQEKILPKNQGKASAHTGFIKAPRIFTLTVLHLFSQGEIKKKRKKKKGVECCFELLLARFGLLCFTPIPTDLLF